jgi:phage gpG-like protein
MTGEEFVRRLKVMEKDFAELYAKEAPELIGNIAVGLFKKNFQDQSFFGAPWREVKRRQGWSRGHHPTDARRKILTGDTGDLVESVEWKISGTGQVTILTDAGAFGGREPYARVHNEGLRAGRGNGFTMPKRQFVGDHPTVRRAIIEGLEKELKRISEKNG